MHVAIWVLRMLQFTIEVARRNANMMCADAPRWFHMHDRTRPAEELLRHFQIFHTYFRSVAIAIAQVFGFGGFQFAVSSQYLCSFPACFVAGSRINTAPPSHPGC
jgi:hypothetical protein